MDPSNTRSPRLISPADVRKVLLNASPVSSFDATEAIYTSYEGPKGRDGSSAASEGCKGGELDILPEDHSDVRRSGAKSGTRTAGLASAGPRA